MIRFARRRRPLQGDSAPSPPETRNAVSLASARITRALRSARIPFYCQTAKTEYKNSGRKNQPRREKRKFSGTEPTWIAVEMELIAKFPSMPRFSTEARFLTPATDIFQPLTRSLAHSVERIFTVRKISLPAPEVMHWLTVGVGGDVCICVGE